MNLILYCCMCGICSVSLRKVCIAALSWLCTPVLGFVPGDKGHQQWELRHWLSSCLLCCVIEELCVGGDWAIVRRWGVVLTLIFPQLCTWASSNSKKPAFCVLDVSSPFFSLPSQGQAPFTNPYRHLLSLVSARQNKDNIGQPHSKSAINLLCSCGLCRTAFL